MNIRSALFGIALAGLFAGCGPTAPMEKDNPNPGTPGGPGNGNTGYPTGSPGFSVGDQVADLAFLAKLHGIKDAGQDPVKVTLGDFYAMRTQGAKLLYLSGAAEWCTPCNEEADGLVAALADPGYQSAEATYRSAGDTQDPVQIVQVLFQNLDTSPANDATIDRWTAAHKMTFPIGIDPENEVSQYIPADTIPQSLFIKLSDMTLLGRENGYDNVQSLIANLEGYLQLAAK